MYRVSQEAGIVTDILEKAGFEVVSARCKMGAVPKETIGITQEQKIGGPLSCETMCNPIAQAEIMNAEKVDMAVMLGRAWDTIPSFSNTVKSR